MTLSVFLAVTFGVKALVALVQQFSDCSNVPNQGEFRPRVQLWSVLDSNGDGTVDATEMDNASNALRTLDANQDGLLSANELWPKPPFASGGFKGPERPWGTQASPFRSHKRGEAARLSEGLPAGLFWGLPSWLP